jgi:REP element-mobilizing transposase RayT
MARQLRVEFPGAIHHVTSRGNEGQSIFRDDVDREAFLTFLGTVATRLGWSVSSYALMTNHFHLVIKTPEPNLSRGMQWLNGRYAAWFNRRHQRSGHLFQGRFKSFLVDDEVYFKQVLRYVVLNPVRAGMVQRPEDYRWTSYRATAGLEAVPPWLDTAAVFEEFGDHAPCDEYREFVLDGIADETRLWDQARNGMYLGSDEWAKRIREVVESKPRSTDHPSSQRSIGRPHMEAVIAAVSRVAGASVDTIRYDRGNPLRGVAAWLGWNEGWLTLSSIAASLRLRSEGHISSLIRRCDREIGGNAELLRQIDRAVAELRTCVGPDVRGRQARYGEIGVAAAG